MGREDVLTLARISGKIFVAAACLTSSICAVAMTLPEVDNESESEAAERRNGVIMGVIVDEADLPLPGATVRIKGTKLGTVTDINGRFRITNLPSKKTFVLHISYIGYKEVTREVTLDADKSAKLVVKMDDMVVLDEVVVTGTAGGTLRAISQQKVSERIVNVISADQVGMFPDPNVGDALKRIPGVHVQYDQGEAKLVSVRGTDPSKTTIAINGNTIPGTGDTRAVGVDAIPADMVQAIELSKTITPDMDGDAIGGAIDLKTRKAPYKRLLSLGGGGGYSFLTREPAFNGTLTYGERFYGDKLGVMASASMYYQQFGSNAHETPWQSTPYRDGEIFVPRYFQVEQTLMTRFRQSYTLGLDWVISPDHTLTFTGIVNDYKDWRQRYNMKIDDLSGDNKQFNWHRTSGFEDAVIYDDKDDYAEASDALKVLDEDNNGVDDVTGEPYVDYDLQHPEFTPELERHVLAGKNSHAGELTHKQIINGALSGDHNFSFGHLRWNSSIIRTVENRPDMLDLELQSDSPADDSDPSHNKHVKLDLTDPRFVIASSGFMLDDIQGKIKGRSSKDIEEGKVDTWYLDGFKGKNATSEILQQAHDFALELPLSGGDFGSKIKLGAKAVLMSKDSQVLGRVKWKPAYDPTSPHDEDYPEGYYNWPKMWGGFAENMEDVSSRFSNTRYTVGPTVTAEWVASQDVDPNGPTPDWVINTVYNEEMADGYKAHENVYAGFLMLTQQLGPSLKMITGLRLEATDIEYDGNEFVKYAEITRPVSMKNKYLTWLPGLHFRWTPSDNSVVRLAYSRSISRPSYRDLVPYVKSNLKKGEIRLGNSSLKPTVSDNIDLLGEWYTGSIGLISAGIYFKNINDFRTERVWDLAWDEGKSYFPTVEEVEGNPKVQEESLKDYKKRYKKQSGKPVRLYQPLNGGRAQLLGVELAFQRNLGFISRVLRPVSLYANYTHNWILPQQGSDFQLTGTASNLANLSLAYEAKKVNVRLSLNYTSDFLIGTGIDETENRYYDDVLYLDANADYYITPQLSIYLSANNLLGQAQRTYQWRPDYTLSNLENGARIQLGVKYRIF